MADIVILRTTSNRIDLNTCKIYDKPRILLNMCSDSYTWYIINGGMDDNMDIMLRSGKQWPH